MYPLKQMQYNLEHLLKLKTYIVQFVHYFSVSLQHS